jgi:endo-1,4-beta-xylanase
MRRLFVTRTSEDVRVKFDDVRWLTLVAAVSVAACATGVDPADGLNTHDETGGSTSGGNTGHGGASGGTSGNSGSNSAGLSGSGGKAGSGGSAANAGQGASGGRDGGAGGGAGLDAGRDAGGTSGGAGRSNGRGGRGGASGGAGAGGTGAAGGRAGSGAGGSAGAGTLAKFVGNISTGNGVDVSGMKYSKYWDQFTPENAGKWGSVQSSASGSFNWGTLDQFYAYTEQNGIIFKQHNFVWGSQQPSGTPTAAQVENWIKSFCARYPNTKLIDVVNEPPPHTTPNYTANLGAGEQGTYGWITKAFKLAHQYCPGMILILNDYNNLEYSDQENHFIDIVNQVKTGGGPIDAVGCQAHALKGKSASALQSAIDTMASKTGLPVYITEYDIGDANDQGQLSTFQAQFPVFLNTASVHGVTVWGWIVGKTWVSNTGLVNNTTPRPAMTWLMQQLGRPNPPN